MSARDRSANITGYAQPVATVHTPASVSDVVKLVQQAKATGTPLYPVSTGLNYGYGGSSPVAAGAHLVDLGRMNRILNADQISLDNPVAVIEPGVTQAQLYEFLEQHCPGLTFNVTGSARHTSIIGNALDRGVGYFGPRKEDLFGLEIVCGNAELIYTGFRGPLEKDRCALPADHPHAESRLAHSHPYGLGPVLDGLFFQGNFGIVTSACFRLVPKHACQVAVSLALHDAAQLAPFINELARMKREGLINSVTHVANRARTHATLMSGATGYLERACGMAPERARAAAEQALGLVAPGEWASLGALAGTRAQVNAGLAEIRRRMKPYARVKVITGQLLDRGYAVAHALRRLPFARAAAAVIAAIRPLHTLAIGVPTDAAIDNLLWRYGRPDLAADQLDESDCGLIFINPALPLDGALVDRVIGELKATAQGFGHELYITINIETATSLVAVINLLFDRSRQEEVDRAQACAASLLERLHEFDLEVYRARADMMGALAGRDPARWNVAWSLKQVFDPANIIAPGRYNFEAGPASVGTVASRATSGVA